jgi:hypothetical protein
MRGAAVQVLCMPNTTACATIRWYNDDYLAITPGLCEMRVGKQVYRYECSLYQCLQRVSPEKDSDSALVVLEKAAKRMRASEGVPPWLSSFIAMVRNLNRACALSGLAPLRINHLPFNPEDAAFVLCKLSTHSPPPRRTLGKTKRSLAGSRNVRFRNWRPTREPRPA